MAHDIPPLRVTQPPWHGITDPAARQAIDQARRDFVTAGPLLAEVTDVDLCGCTNEELEAGRTCGQPACPNREATACILVGAAGEDPDDCTTHGHEQDPPVARPLATPVYLVDSDEFGDGTAPMVRPFATAQELASWLRACIVTSQSGDPVKVTAIRRYRHGGHLDTLTLKAGETTRDHDPDADRVWLHTPHRLTVDDGGAAACELVAEFTVTMDGDA